jgi:hypothetical protein
VVQPGTIVMTSALAATMAARMLLRLGLMKTPSEGDVKRRRPYVVSDALVACAL